MIPQWRSWWWKIIHPIQWRRINEQNRIIIGRLKAAAVIVLTHAESDPRFDTMTESEVHAELERRLQQAFYEVIK